MKVLLIADEESPYFWDHYKPGMLDGIDLILSAGDLKKDYLEFLATMCKAPLLYVCGNHDTSFENDPPGGCRCVDGDLVEVNGLRVLGLGGCRKYSKKGVQYTEHQMRKRVLRIWYKFIYYGGADIILTHAPLFGVGDGTDLPHRGFRCFNRLVALLKPGYVIHGHIHMSYGANMPRTRSYDGATVINACEKYIIDIPERASDLTLHKIVRNLSEKTLSALRITGKL